MSRQRQAAAKPSPYSVHPGVAMMQKWVVTLPEKTGRSLDEWLALVRESGPAAEAERREWLKREHGLGTNSAWWIACRAEGRGAEEDSPEGYLQAAAGWVEAMFAGSKAGLRPVYNELLRLGKGLGPDVRVCPCKTIVPLYRKHVFAQIKPATTRRIDLGLALGDLPAGGRLISTGGFLKGDRITHRIPITAVTEIDGEARCWLTATYDLDR